MNESDTKKSGIEALKETASDVREEFANSASKAGDQLKAGAASLRSAAVDKSENAKDRAAGEISRTADALDAAADNSGDGSVQQQLLREAANGLSNISGKLEGKSVGDIASDLSDFGRNNPVAFLGGAALIGFALARFARASDRTRSEKDSPPFRGAGQNFVDSPQQQPYVPASRQSGSPGQIGLGSEGVSNV